MSRRNRNRRRDRAEQSRINGALSNGPVTPEGKARSAENATTHGFHARRVVLSNENATLYNTILERYCETLNPNDTFEHELVQTIVDARWRVRRAQTLESTTYELALANSQRDLEVNFVTSDSSLAQAYAFEWDPKLERRIEMFNRMEQRFQNIYERTYKLLARHRNQTYSALPDLTALEADLPDNFTQTQTPPEPPQYQPPPPPKPPQSQNEPTINEELIRRTFPEIAETIIRDHYRRIERQRQAQQAQNPPEPCYPQA